MLEPLADSPLPPLPPAQSALPPAPGEAPPLAFADHPPAPATRWTRFPSNKSLAAALLLLTALGAFFRFWRLTFQCYWTDESYTVDRIHGTFHQMLASLSDQGFPPGWYALLRWWTMAAKYFTGSGYEALTPEVTRSLTALLGTLTVPAMYFLARQFTDRKGALLVTLLAAVNPFLIYYSRDIKMYPATWFFIVLNTAIFFKWQTTHKHLLWFPLYVLTGFLMIAMHTSAWFMVGLQLIFLITRPRIKALDAPLWLTAVGLMALLPIYWYRNGTTWVDKLVQRDGDSGLPWVKHYTDMSWHTIVSLPCSHLLGYLWPSLPPDARVRDWFHLGPPGGEFDHHLATRVWPWMASAEFYVALAFAAILLLGLIPWRGFRRSPERRASVTRYRFWWIAVWLILPTLVLALTWIPKSSPWHERIWHSFNPTPIWEPRYLGLLVPAWLLWMAAALRRLPTWPLRTLAITFVTCACAFSALSNHLIYRNPPFQRAAAIAVQYYNPAKRTALAVGHVDLTYPGKVVPLTYDLACKIRPFTPGSWFLPYQNFQTWLETPEQALEFLRDVRINPQVQTIVLTDRRGDITDPADPLSNDYLAEKLGPRWKLVQQQTYDLHFEWRFYIYNTWRTRVWQRQPPATITPTPSPAPR